MKPAMDPELHTHISLSSKKVKNPNSSLSGYVWMQACFYLKKITKMKKYTVCIEMSEKTKSHSKSIVITNLFDIYKGCFCYT